MTQVLAIEDKDRTARVEQLALDRIGQRALASARQATEQDRRRLLAEALGAFFHRHMGQFAMVRAAAMGQRLGDDHAGADRAVGQAIDDDERASGAVAS